VNTELELRHLRREVKTALELALVALAPSELIDRLGVAAGLLDAVNDLPSDSAPVAALIPSLVDRARSALGVWREWEDKHVQKAFA